MDARVADTDVEPYALRSAPALIERVWPAQKISVETKREFDAHGAQTLTPLGSYWKGRKRLVYVRACVLGALLPATDDAEQDLAIFEKLMAIDDAAFLFRENKLKAGEVARLALEAEDFSERELAEHFRIGRTAETEGVLDAAREGKVERKKDSDDTGYARFRLAAYSRLSYEEKVSRSLRPEELPDEAYDGIWDEVNAHLGTSARSHSELIEQLGIMRFGHRPKVADTFCGAGSIPFEAARLGCDVYASDLNPVACMLTWGALHLIGGGEELKDALEKAQRRIAKTVDKRISKLGIEHDAEGNRAKAYLYCVEIRCPVTGWLIPVLPSLVISRIKGTIGRLVPNEREKRLDIEIVSAISGAELAAARLGTLQDRAVVYEIKGEQHRIPFAAIRGDDARNADAGNKLRRWEKADVAPRPDDILGERLYCIQWITKDTLDKHRQETFFAAPTAADLKREAKVTKLVQANFASWQENGFVPDMQIEAGIETARLLRERGWTHWHHLFMPRQLLIAAMVAAEMAKEADEEVRACLAFDRTFIAHNSARLSQWLPGTPGKEGRAPSADTVKHVFYNNALNTFFNFGCRGFLMVKPEGASQYRHPKLTVRSAVETLNATASEVHGDIFITDPPYADAVNYHEITEFFIAWLRKNPPEPFKDWVWDSRRPLAIKGDGVEFRRAMVAAYRAMADRMPDNGLQIVMFTHKDAGVWADMVQIFWGAGLRVMADWYVATETSSETKKGGYVTGTHTLVLKKRGPGESGYKDEIVQEVRAEVAHQIDTMVGLNQALKGHGRVDNLFEDADLQMAGYAAALRVLTGYARIDGVDMTREALRMERPRDKDLVADIIEFAVQVANEHLVPDGMRAAVWARLCGAERFFYRMMDVETTGARKLDNYQNFAKAFRVTNFGDLMQEQAPNRARLKTARELKKAGFEGSEFGASKSRALLYAIYEIQSEAEGDDVIAHLHDLVRDYGSAREDLLALADYIAKKRAGVDDEESRAARIVHGLIRNERLG